MSARQWKPKQKSGAQKRREKAEQQARIMKTTKSLYDHFGNIQKSTQLDNFQKEESEIAQCEIVTKGVKRPRDNELQEAAVENSVTVDKIELSNADHVAVSVIKRARNLEPQVAEINDPEISTARNIKAEHSIQSQVSNSTAFFTYANATNLNKVSADKL